MSARVRPQGRLMGARDVFAFWVTGSPEERQLIERFVDKLLQRTNVRLESPALRLVVDNTPEAP